MDMARIRHVLHTLSKGRRALRVAPVVALAGLAAPLVAGGTASAAPAPPTLYTTAVSLVPATVAYGSEGTVEATVTETSVSRFVPVGAGTAVVSVPGGPQCTANLTPTTPFFSTTAVGTCQLALTATELLPGSYSVGTTGTLPASAATTPATLTVDPTTPTVAVTSGSPDPATLSPAGSVPVTYTATVDPSTASWPTPTGTVTITSTPAAGGPSAQCSTTTLTATATGATAGCTIDETAAGSYDVTAAYTAAAGPYTDAASSPGTPFVETVDPAPTATLAVTSGSPDPATLSAAGTAPVSYTVRIVPPSAVAPSAVGDVVVTSTPASGPAAAGPEAPKTCTVSLTARSADTGSCSITEDMAGTYDVTARYAPATAIGSYGALSTTAPYVETVDPYVVPVTVITTPGTTTTTTPTTPTTAAGGSSGSYLPTTTTLSLSTPVVDYGAEGGEVFTVGVAGTAGDTAGVPTGTVTVEQGSGLALCQVTLVGGAGSCSPAGSVLPVGTWAVMAVYQGEGSTYDGSTSAPAAELTVDQAGTTVPTTVTSGTATSTSLTNTPATVTYGAENVETFTATVTAATGTPDGVVLVETDGAVVCTVTLVNGTGSCSLTADELTPGTYSLVGAYPGSVDPDAASTSAPVSLTVLAAPATAAAGGTATTGTGTTGTGTATTTSTVAPATLAAGGTTTAATTPVTAAASGTTPVGAPETGGGSAARVQDVDLFGAGGFLLAAGAATLLLGRRRRTAR